MTVYTFEKVSLRSMKTANCDYCGKRALRRKEFWMTLNPYNVNTDGSPRTRQEIYDLLRQQIRDWHSKPTNHARCEREAAEKENK